MRARVAGFRTAHSLILTTFHPSRLSDCATRRLCRLLVSILLPQNSVLVRGRDHLSPDGPRALKVYDVAFSAGQKGEIEQRRIDQQLALIMSKLPNFAYCAPS